MLENKDFAFEIASIAALLIERESEPNIALLGTNLDTEFNQGKYLIKLQIIPNELGKKYLVIEAEEKNFLIEMIDGQLTTAIGIEDDDIKYWQQLELVIYS